MSLSNVGELSRSALGTVAALLGHGLLLGMAWQPAPAPHEPVAVTEVEWLPPPAPAPAPELHEVAPTESPNLPRAPRHVARRQAAPPAASAAPVRSVEDSVKTSDEPVRFVSDPNGGAFGYGVVRRGGVGSVGTGAGTPSAAPPTASGEGTQPALSRPPMLGEQEPCRGFFPARAQADRGEAALKVRIEADGSVRAVTVAREAPSGQGFGAAARECLLSKRFSPALDLAGKPVSVLSPVTVRFSR